MGFNSGKLVVTASSANALMTPQAAGAILVQSQGTAAVCFGGPGVTYGAGVIIGAVTAGSASLPVAIQASHFGNIESADDGLYAIAQAGSATVSWLQGA